MVAPLSMMSMASSGQAQTEPVASGSPTAEAHSPDTPQQSYTDPCVGSVKRARLSCGNGLSASVAPQQRLLALNSVILTSRTMTVAVDGPDSTVTSTTTTATSGTSAGPYLVSSTSASPSPRPQHLSHGMRMAGALHDAAALQGLQHQPTAAEKSHAQSVSGYTVYGRLPPSGHLPSTSQLCVSVHDSPVGPNSGSAGQSPASSSLGPPSARSTTSLDSSSDVQIKRPTPSSLPAVTPQVRLMQLRKRAANIRGRVRGVELCECEYHACGELQALVGGCNRRMVVPRTRNDDSDDSAKSKKRANGPKTEELYALEEKLEVLLKNTDFKRNFFRKEELKSKSASELVKLIKKYEPKKLHELLSPAAVRFLYQPLKRRPLSLAADEADNICANAAALGSHVRTLQRDYDSEATDSSSGGEDDDDDESLRLKIGPKKCRLTRAQEHERVFTCERDEYRYLSERSDAGRQWVWLQSQVGDLEYKIRQHVDIYRQLRARPAPVLPSTAAPHDDTHTCARVRPCQVTGRRKVVNTTGMFRWNRKSGRLSTVACACTPPLAPCILCSGRVNNTNNVPDMCSQTIDERVSLIDHTYNPVLTTRSGLAFDSRLQAYLKTQASVSTVHKRSHSKNKSKDEKRLKAGTCPSSSPTKKANKIAPLRIKVPKEFADSAKPSPPGKAKRKVVKSSWSKGTGSVSSSRATSPYSPSVSDATGKPGKLSAGNRRTTSHHTPCPFDIDNIFIDPTVAAVTRVERLQYKEIDTPKWREVSVEYGNPASTSDLNISGVDTEVENLSDDCFVKRHLTNELAERKRFQAYKEMVNGPLNSSSRRGSHSSLSDAGSLGLHKTQDMLIKSPTPPKSASQPTLHIVS